METGSEMASKGREGMSHPNKISTQGTKRKVTDTGSSCTKMISVVGAQSRPTEDNRPLQNMNLNIVKRKSESLQPGHEKKGNGINKGNHNIFDIENQSVQELFKSCKNESSKCRTNAELQPSDISRPRGANSESRERVGNMKEHNNFDVQPLYLESPNDLVPRSGIDPNIFFGLEKFDFTRKVGSGGPVKCNGKFKNKLDKTDRRRKERDATNACIKGLPSQQFETAKCEKMKDCVKRNQKVHSTKNSNTQMAKRLKRDKVNRSKLDSSKVAAASGGDSGNTHFCDFSRKNGRIPKQPDAGCKLRVRSSRWDIKNIQDLAGESDKESSENQILSWGTANCLGNSCVVPITEGIGHHWSMKGLSCTSKISDNHKFHEDSKRNHKSSNDKNSDICVVEATDKHTVELGEQSGFVQRRKNTSRTDEIVKTISVLGMVNKTLIFKAADLFSVVSMQRQWWALFNLTLSKGKEDVQNEPEVDEIADSMIANIKRHIFNNISSKVHAYELIAYTEQGFKRCYKKEIISSDDAPSESGVDLEDIRCESGMSSGGIASRMHLFDIEDVANKIMANFLNGKKVSGYAVIRYTEEESTRLINKTENSSNGEDGPSTGGTSCDVDSPSKSGVVTYETVDEPDSSIENIPIEIDTSGNGNDIPSNAEEEEEVIEIKSEELWSENSLKKGRIDSGNIYNIERDDIRCYDLTVDDDNHVEDIEGDDGDEVMGNIRQFVNIFNITQINNSTIINSTGTLFNMIHEKLKDKDPEESNPYQQIGEDPVKISSTNFIGRENEGASESTDENVVSFEGHSGFCLCFECLCQHPGSDTVYTGECDFESPVKNIVHKTMFHETLCAMRDEIINSQEYSHGDSIFKNSNDDVSSNEHDRKRKFICKVCWDFTYSPEVIQRHVQSHVYIPPRTRVRRDYECLICDKKFLTASLVLRHLQYRHYKDNQFRCQICDVVFKSSSFLHNHYQSHMVGMEYPCLENNCNYKTKKIHTYRRHLQAQHVKKSSCRFCKTPFDKETNFLNHFDSEEHKENVNLYRGIQCLQEYQREIIMRLLEGTTYTSEIYQLLKDDLCEIFELKVEHTPTNI